MTVWTTPPTSPNWIQWHFPPRLRGTQGEFSGFTLIELLIVVTIIAIIGVASISGFSRMAEVQDSETTTKIISNALDILDRSISNHEIGSYDVVFESGSLGYVTNIDWYWKTPFLQYAFDFTTRTGSVTSIGTGTGIIELQFASYDALWENRMLFASGGTQLFAFPRNIQKRRYQVSSTIYDRALNTGVIQYYNLTNIYNVPEKEVRLIKIEGTTGTPYSSLFIRNVRGKKSLQGSSGATLDSLEQATLTFEKNGKEMAVVVSR